jgi:hypothetical protein
VEQPVNDVGGERCTLAVHRSSLAKWDRREASPIEDRKSATMDHEGLVKDDFFEWRVPNMPLEIQPVSQHER